MLHLIVLYCVCRLAAQMQFRFPQFVPTPLSQLIPNASAEGVALMQVQYILLFYVVVYFYIHHFP